MATGMPGDGVIGRRSERVRAWISRPHSFDDLARPWYGLANLIRYDMSASEVAKYGDPADWERARDHPILHTLAVDYEPPGCDTARIVSGAFASKLWRGAPCHSERGLANGAYEFHFELAFDTWLRDLHDRCLDRVERVLPPEAQGDIDLYCCIDGGRGMKGAPLPWMAPYGGPPWSAARVVVNSTRILKRSRFEAKLEAAFHNPLRGAEAFCAWDGTSPCPFRTRLDQRVQ